MGRRPKRTTPDGVAEIDGYVVIDKPAGMTSHDVVARARRALSSRRIGHAGTLDPGATGVLVLGVGRATRLLRYVSDLPKRYSGEIVFGVTTDTLDDDGETTAVYDMDDLTIDRVRLATSNLTGTIEQIPPMVSAIKIEGRRLYDLARQGIEVERAPRTVTISRFEVEPTNESRIFAFSVDCSSGTYVRSLVADLGVALGGGAHLRRLRRTSIGSFDLVEAVALDSLARSDVEPPIGLVRHLDEVVVADQLVADIAHGKILDRRSLEIVGEGPWALSSHASRLLAVYETWTTDRIKPTVVLIDTSELNTRCETAPREHNAPDAASSQSASSKSEPTESGAPESVPGIALVPGSPSSVPAGSDSVDSRIARSSTDIATKSDER